MAKIRVDKTKYFGQTSTKMAHRIREKFKNRALSCCKFGPNDALNQHFMKLGLLVVPFISQYLVLSICTICYKISFLDKYQFRLYNR